MNLLENIKSNNTAKGTKQTYTLDEILFVMKQLSDGKTVQDVSALTGRSVHTLRYKFLEGEVILNGKAVIRSVKKYATMEELFADHGVEFKGDEDIKQRIANYEQKLNAGNVAV
jgi:hypothetical protein